MLLLPNMLVFLARSENNADLPRQPAKRKFLNDNIRSSTSTNQIRTSIACADSVYRTRRQCGRQWRDVIVVDGCITVTRCRACGELCFQVKVKFCYLYWRECFRLKVLTSLHHIPVLCSVQLSLESEHRVFTLHLLDSRNTTAITSCINWATSKKLSSALEIVHTILCCFLTEVEVRMFALI